MSATTPTVPAPAPGINAPGVSVVSPTSGGRRQRAKALFARLRHKQLLSAMAGRIGESAVYARRAVRVRRAVRTCAG